jgi:MFS family permease
MTILILGGVMLQWPLGRLSDRFDRRSVIIGLSAALTLTSAAMVMVANAGAQSMLLAVALLFGGLSFTIYPVSLAHTNDYVGKDELVAASGGLILANSIGAVLGPLLGSLAMAALGPEGLFGFTASGAGAAMAFGLWRMRMRPPLPAEAQAAFRPLPQTTPAVTPLDPLGPLKPSPAKT